MKGGAWGVFWRSDREAQRGIFGLWAWGCPILSSSTVVFKMPPGALIVFIPRDAHSYAFGSNFYHAAHFILVKQWRNGAGAKHRLFYSRSEMMCSPFESPLHGKWSFWALAGFVTRQCSWYLVFPGETRTLLKPQVCCGSVWFQVIRTKDKEAGASEILGELDFFANQSKKPPSPSDDGREGNGLREPRVEALESQPENKGNEPKLVGKARAAEKRKGDGQSMEGRGKKKKAQGKRMSSSF